jgi:hypothetical protein
MECLARKPGAIHVQEVIPVAKSRPYSSVPVKSVEIESLAKAHAGQACVLGVDVAKFELIAVLRWPDSAFQKPWRIVNPDELGLLIALLTKLAALGCPVTVALESSGTYGDALRQALDDAGIPLRRVSAKAVKDQAETFDGVPSQHDGKDAAIIADLCARGKCAEWSQRATADAAADRELRYWVRKLDGAQRIKQMWAGKIEGLLARHWPEVTRLVSACYARNTELSITHISGLGALKAARPEVSVPWTARKRPPCRMSDTSDSAVIPAWPRDWLGFDLPQRRFSREKQRNSREKRCG